MAPRGDVERGLAAARDAAGIFTDFDGTLAKIVDDPEAALPLPGAADTLAALTRRFSVVGVVSGRPGAFLDRHFGGRGIRLWGLYGLQQVIDGQVVEDDDVARWRPVVEDVATPLKRGYAEYVRRLTSGEYPAAAHQYEMLGEEKSKFLARKRPRSS